MQRCRKCGAYSNYTKIRFDHMGICSYCGFYEKHRNVLEQKTALEKSFLLKMEIGKAKARASGARYDCLAAFSGGKRSAYMICQLKEVYHMRILAFTFDRSPSKKRGQGYRRDILEKLHVDSITFSPDGPDMGGSGCDPYLAYIHSIYHHSYLLAGQYKIPLILNGRPKRRILQRADSTEDIEPFETAHDLMGFERQIFREMGVGDPGAIFDKTEFLDDVEAEAVSYFAYHDVSEKKIVQTLEEKIGWIRTRKNDTYADRFSHDMAERMYLEKNGFPYRTGELAFLVRTGKLTPDQADEILQKKQQTFQEHGLL